MGTTTVWTSADGKTWALKTNQIQVVQSNFNVVALAKGNGTYIALDYQGRILSSLDLINWTNRGQPLGAITNATTCVFNGTKFVFSVSTGTPPVLTMYSSTTGYSGFGAGVTTATVGATPITITGTPLNMIAVGATVYCQTGGYLLSSADGGATWTGVISNSGVSNLFYANNAFFCGSGALQVSADGANWRSMTALNPPSYIPAMTSTASGGATIVSQFGGAYGASSLVINATDTSKTIVYSGFDQFIDNFVATNTGGNPFYMRIQ